MVNYIAEFIQHQHTFDGESLAENLSRGARSVLQKVGVYPSKQSLTDLHGKLKLIEHNFGTRKVPVGWFVEKTFPGHSTANPNHQLSYLLTLAELSPANRQAENSNDNRIQRNGAAEMAQEYIVPLNNLNPCSNSNSHSGNSKFTLSDLIQSNEVISGVGRYIQSMTHLTRFSEWGVQPSRCMLFAGPPGTGKTFAAQIVAQSVCVDSYVVHVPNLYSAYHGETENRLSAILQQPGLYFLDELDALGGERGGSSAYQTRIVTTLLSMLDGPLANPDVYVIAATNVVQVLDGALTRSGRFGNIIRFELPDEQQVGRLLLHYASKVNERVDCKVIGVDEIDVVDIGNLAGRICHSDVKIAIDEAVVDHVVESGDVRENCIGMNLICEKLYELAS